MNDALDAQRSKSKGVIVSFGQSHWETILTYVLFGSLAVLFGVSIYYYLPMALLQENYNTMLQIFFLILLGMLFGLTILAMNLQGVLEAVLIQVLLFWESKSMRTILFKNLIAHKQRNILTSIIYALTLGSIIFLIVSANLQLQQITDLNTVENADIVVGGDFDPTNTDSDESLLFAADVDPILAKYASDIKDFGYVTGELFLQQSDKGANYVSDKSRLVTLKSSVQALSPSTLLDDSLYLGLTDETSELGVTE